MKVVLIHGMARSPLAMALLGWRLRRGGHKPRWFGYVPALESFTACTQRLVSQIESQCKDNPYALVGHSLGTVLIRNALPALQKHPPTACFFLAPPSVACQAAKFFANNPLYRLLMGEMGQLLGNVALMNRLPVPLPDTWIFAGTRGLPYAFSPFGTAPNDGILTVAETQVAGIPQLSIPATHTFIMNHPIVAAKILEILKLKENCGS